MNIGIIGLGLIGGSLAKAVKANTDYKVFVYDINTGVVAKAIREQIADGIADKNMLAECDCLLLALYPADVKQFLKTQISLLKKGSLIIDCAGVKRGICELSDMAAKAGVRFIGGHPMAGIEKSGYDNSFAELFSGASMILCVDEHTDTAAVKEAGQLFLSLGFGNIKTSTAETHDKMIAYTSQLAHIISSAYVKTSSAKIHYGFSANSFKDLTRVARLDEVMWTELFFENRDNLLFEAKGMAERLNEYIDALKSDDRDSMKRLLKEGTLAKEATERGEGELWI